MKPLLRQLTRWRFRERLVRLVWGGARCAAVVLTVLAVACAADWLYDRYDDVPFALRAAATAGQVALAAGLSYALLVRPWVRTPPVDDLALAAEKAIPEFGHRLVTALQLNRPGARTYGMSPALIAEVTREAGEMAARHRLTRLINYRPVGRGAAVLAPVVLAWAAFVAAFPALAVPLLRRQALQDAEIPRSVRLENATAEVWPTGSEVTVRYRVTGAWAEAMAGRAFIHPDDQPTDEYALAFERPADDGAAYFVAKLPPSATPFSFRARLADGRTRTPGRVTFEAPPQVREVEAWQLLPVYLGRDPLGGPYTSYQVRGEVLNAPPLSGLRVEARFNKPVVRATLVPVERSSGNSERDVAPLSTADRGLAALAGAAAVPGVLACTGETAGDDHALAALVGVTALPGLVTGGSELSDDGTAATWVFPLTPKVIGYRIELTDSRGFVSPAPARRGVRMMPDEPPAVEFKRESNRNPDPLAFEGQGDPRAYEWDMPVSWRPSAVPGEGDTGPVQVIYAARSDLGIGRVNLAYRVIPRGAQAENLHPRDDPNERVFKRLPLTPYAADRKKVGKWVPDLGLFENSFLVRTSPKREYLTDEEQDKVQVELYRLPSPDPATEPGGREAGGRYNFQTDGLRKIVSAGGGPAKLEPGDTVELYVEVFDKLSAYREAKNLPPRPAGYPREAKRKTVVSEEDAVALLRQRDEAQRKLQDKLRDLVNDQRDVFQPKKKP